jgi:Rne/Rng family ribonuclease
MHKELIIATTSQESKLAILEDDELVEFYIERRRSQGIVGNIYKGRVTKVLPGMQSAFVDIGLERDAFLYVSDFLEDTDEYEKIVATVEAEVANFQSTPTRPSPAPSTVPSPAAVPAVLPAPAALRSEIVEAEVSGNLEADAVASEVAAAQVESPAAPVRESFDRGGGGGRRRDRPADRDRNRDQRGGGGGGKKPRIPSFEPRSQSESRPMARPSEARQGNDERPWGSIEALPGESLAKYASRPAHQQQPEPERQQPPVEEPFSEPVSALFEASPIANISLDADIPAVDMEPEVSDPSEDSAPPNTSARINDPSDDFRFSHRASQRRPRRRGGNGGGPGGGDGNGAPVRSEETRSAAPGPKGGLTIAELLREGQEILVQVSKEPLGKKGARITSHIALPGRYLVYMPTVDHVGVSRKIATDEERQRLKRVINENRSGLPGGFIVRTAAEGRSESEFVQDIRFLGNLWSDIRSKSEKKSAPALIHSDLNLVQRTLRDQLSEDFTAIRIDNEQEFATILDFVNKFQPALVSRVKLHLKDTPIFEEFGLNSEIDKALRPKVWLKSGGYIVINQTEALVAIDVNTGKFVGKSNRLEDTITKTNVDAVHEIVRQIRLRNLGGIIVVDFIDMEEKKNRQRVMTALEDQLKLDRSPSKILQFNDFGLVAITRKRTQPSLERVICSPCSHCNGSGWVRSAESVCYEIQTEIRKMSHLLEGKQITIRVNPEVAKVLKGSEFVSLSEIEEWTRKDVVVKSDPLLHEEHFDIF